MLLLMLACADDPVPTPTPGDTDPTTDTAPVTDTDPGTTSACGDGASNAPLYTFGQDFDRFAELTGSYTVYGVAAGGELSIAAYVLDVGADGLRLCRDGALVAAVPAERLGTPTIDCWNETVQGSYTGAVCYEAHHWFLQIPQYGAEPAWFLEFGYDGELALSVWTDIAHEEQSWLNAVDPSLGRALRWGTTSPAELGAGVAALVDADGVPATVTWGDGAFAVDLGADGSEDYAITWTGGDGLVRADWGDGLAGDWLIGELDGRWTAQLHGPAARGGLEASIADGTLVRVAIPGAVLVAP